MLLRADVMFDVTCSWIFSSDSCVMFKDDLRFAVKAAAKLFVTNSDKSEVCSDLRSAVSVIAVTLAKFVLVGNVSFTVSASCEVDGPGRKVKLIVDSTK